MSMDAMVVIGLGVLLAILVGRKIMADFTKLNDALADLSTKQAAAFTDLKAVIAKGSVEDPAIQAGIDSAAASVGSLAADAMAADPGPQ